MLTFHDSLDDLQDACRLAGPSKNLAKEDQSFEVGVFNGQYVTPVPDGYFEHLERVRGENKKMKVIENAREAVAKGSAGKEELQIATNGAEVTSDGKVVPSYAPRTDSSKLVNGHTSPSANSKRKRTIDEAEPAIRNRQDISIHNQDDFEEY